MKYFKLNKVRRFIILGVTIVSAILAIALGSTLYVSKNGRKSFEYGGGAEYLVKITPDSKYVQNGNFDGTQIADEIYERINALGINGADAQYESSGGVERVRVTYPDIKNDEDKKAIEKLITEKPKLVFTDVYGNPLFDKFQKFNTQLIGHHESLIDPLSDSITPLASGGASGIISDGDYKVQINLIPSKESEWTDATRYISTLPEKDRRVVAWLNIKEFVQFIKGKYPSIWSESKGNPYLAAHVGASNILPLRTYTINAAQYLISDASVSAPLSGSSFVIQGTFKSLSGAKELAKKINYGSSKYQLKLEYSNYVTATYGTSAFNKAMIAGLIVFALIAIFLVANYGLLGALSTISIALYVFITLTLFTVMRGEYSPEAIAALIIGVGMAVDANIITYERLKNEVYGGSSILKGYKDANKKSLSSIFDANITTLIVAFVLFFFGTRSIIGLSVTLILSIALTLVVMLGFTRFMATMLVKTGVFNERKSWLGFHQKFDQKIQTKINKFNYIGSSKWFAIGSASIFGVALIVLSITAGLAGKFTGGFNLSQDFTGGTLLQLIPLKDQSYISASDVQSFENVLSSHGISQSDLIFENTGTHISSIKYQTKDVFDDISTWGKTMKLSTGQFIQSTTSNDVANNLIFNALIAISVAIAGIIVYTLIRFHWTYSLSAIVALLHDALIVVAAFIITRVEISPVFVAGLLSIIGYSINDTIVTFDRIRENMNKHEGPLDDKVIIAIANNSIKETLKRSILTSFTTIVAVLVLMSFGNATKMAFNLAMLVGLIAGTYSSIFIASYLWTKLEIHRRKSIDKRANKNFWNTGEVEEQTFVGINDFKS